MWLEYEKVLINLNQARLIQTDDDLKLWIIFKDLHPKKGWEPNDLTTIEFKKWKDMERTLIAIKKQLNPFNCNFDKEADLIETVPWDRQYIEKCMNEQNR